MRTFLSQENRQIFQDRRETVQLTRPEWACPHSCFNFYRVLGGTSCELECKQGFTPSFFVAIQLSKSNNRFPNPKATKSKKMENQEKKWHQKPMWIYVLSFVFFPVGLYLLWKNQEIAKKTKIIVTCCVGVFVLIAGQGGDKKL